MDRNGNFIRLAGTVHESTVDGDGFRLVIFTQGCNHHCKNCQNQHTHDVYGGFEISVSALIDEVTRKLKNNPMLSGITISGGEPFLQPEACAKVAKCVKQMGKSVWVYTGYEIEQLLDTGLGMDLLNYTDFLVDGPYIEEKRDTRVPFRGSSNQRIIKVQPFVANYLMEEKLKQFIADHQTEEKLKQCDVKLK